MFEMHLELIDIWRDIGTFRGRGESSLLHAKHGRGKGCDALCFKYAACLEALPCCWDFDTYSLHGDVWCQGFEYVDNACAC